MSEILLEQWAERQKVKRRTAQQWAKTGIIPAKKKAKTIVMEKTWQCWVIDESTPLPAERKAS